MPWCPKCGIEYREGFTTCNDCNCELVENPVQTETEAEPKYDREAFLVSVDDSIEAEMIEELLNENNIPVLKKYGDAGDVLKIYVGSTNFGVDMYVPSHMLDRAKEVIEANQGAFGEAVIPEDELEAQALEAEPQDEEPQDEEPQDEEPQDEEPQDEEPQDEEPQDEEPEGPEDQDGETGDEELDGVTQSEELQNIGSQNVETGDSESQDEKPSLFQKFSKWLTGK